MMKNLTNDKVFFNQRAKVRRPLRSFRELAEHLGVSYYVFLVAFKDLDAPKPILRHASHSYSNRWYDPQEVIEWWNQRSLRPSLVRRLEQSIVKALGELGRATARQVEDHPQVVTACRMAKLKARHRLVMMVARGEILSDGAAQAPVYFLKTKV